jgi:hypothetical protein
MPNEKTQINDAGDGAPAAGAESTDDKNNAGNGDAGTDNPAAPASGDDNNQNNQGQQKPGDEVDYKAELERVNTQLGQAEHTIETLKKGKKKPGEAGTEEEQQQQPDVGQVVEQKFDELRSDLLSDFITDTVKGLTDNPDKQALILHHYNNSIRHSGSSKAQVQADLELAAAMADAPRIRKEHAEMQRTLANKKTIQNTGGGSNQDHSGPELPEGDIPISNADKAFMDSIGITKEDVKKNVTEGQ